MLARPPAGQNISRLQLCCNSAKNGKGQFCYFFTNPIVKKNKADTKVKNSYDRNATRKCG